MISTYDPNRRYDMMSFMRSIAGVPANTNALIPPIQIPDVQPLLPSTQPEFVTTLEMKAWKEPPPTSFQEMLNEQGRANLQEHQALNAKFHTTEQIQYHRCEERFSVLCY